MHDLLFRYYAISTYPPNTPYTTTEIHKDCVLSPKSQTIHKTTNLSTKYLWAGGGYPADISAESFKYRNRNLIYNLHSNLSGQET